MNSLLTADIKPEWEDVTRRVLNIIRRLQSEAKTDGCAILTIHVACDNQGIPVCWTSPVVTRLEPKASCSIDDLMDLLTK